MTASALAPIFSSKGTVLGEHVWLRRGHYPMPERYELLETLADLKAYVDAVGDSLLHYDFETNGLQYWRKDQHVVGIGLWHKNAALPAYLRLDNLEFINTEDENPQEAAERAYKQWTKKFLDILLAHKLCAFNNVFDGGWLFKMNRSLSKKEGRRPDHEVLDALYSCSLTLYRHAGNEGYKGQSHSLETAQESLLGWPAEGQKAWLKGALEEHKLKKADMWKLQDLYPDEFAYYAATDAMACGLVWQHLVNECERMGYPNLVEFHLNEGMSQIREFIVTAWEGIPFNKKKGRAYLVSSYKKALDYELQLRNHPEVSPHVARWEAEKFAATFSAAITEKVRKIEDSEIIKRALADYDAVDEEVEEEEIPSPQDNQAKGKSKPCDPYIEMPTAEGGTVVERYLQLKVVGDGKKLKRFNFDAPTDRKWLMYECLGHGEKVTDEFKKEVWKYTYKGEVFYLPPTKHGACPTGKEIFPVLGEVGQLLSKYIKWMKQYSYAKAYLAASLYDGKIHPTFAPSGTATGRSKATGGINVQQLSKVQEFLECFEAPKGWVFYGRDFKALEKVVQAEFSGDPVLKELYAGDKDHDVHFFNTARIHPDAHIREQLMARYRPEEDIISQLKKEFKTPRELGKGLGFAMDYGAGAYKNWRTANIKGFKIDFDTTKKMVAAYKELYKGVYKWGEKLYSEWEHRGGFIEDGLGLPVCVPENFSKDLVSRHVQRVGHYILMMLCMRIRELLRPSKIGYSPAIPDLHDERIDLVKEKDAEELDRIYSEALHWVNETLQPNIPFKMSATTGKTLWDFKKD